MKIGLIGGGPSALFVLKRLVEYTAAVQVEIFERAGSLGEGMPYGVEGAGLEHVTNVSSSELPPLVDSLGDWVQGLADEELERYGLDRARFDEDKVLPRLLFGRYLCAQFEKYIQAAPFPVTVHLATSVLDIKDRPSDRLVDIIHSAGRSACDYVVVCTGHHWPRRHEDRVPGFYDSPYPPSKLRGRKNYAVALRGSSLTAVDAIRTLARHNGRFVRRQDGELDFLADPESRDFEIVMHNRSGLLPCVRVHLADPQVTEEGLLTPTEWLAARRDEAGFVPLDLFFEEDFKRPLQGTDPDLY